MFKKNQKEGFLADLKAGNTKKSEGGTPDTKPTPPPTSLLRLINLYLRNEHEKDEQTEMSGLTDTRCCIKSKCLDCVVRAMVANTLSYDNTEKHPLVIYFFASTLRNWDGKQRII